MLNDLDDLGYSPHDFGNLPVASVAVACKWQYNVVNPSPKDRFMGLHECSKPLVDD